MAGVSETKTISERLAPVQFTAGADCAETGVVKGVCICGLSSANGRDYPADVLRKAAPLYEGAQVYLDHLDERGRSRGVREWFGEIRNVRSRADGRPEGDLHYPAEHHFAAEFKSRADSFKKSLGLSHVVEAKTSRKNGRELVEEIQSVQSVDLVASPATNTSLTESKGAAVGITAKQLAEWVTRHPASTTHDIERAKRFAEDMGDMGLADASVMDAPADDTEPGSGLKTGIQAGIMELLETAKSFGGDSEDAEVLKHIKTLMTAHGKVTGAAGDKDTDDSDEGKEMPKESKQPVKAADMLAECKQLQFSPTYEQGEHLCRITDADTRKLVIESFKAAAKVSEAEPPRSAGRSQLKTESKPVNAEPTIDEIKKNMRG